MMTQNPPSHVLPNSQMMVSHWLLTAATHMTATMSFIRKQVFAIEMIMNRSTQFRHLKRGLGFPVAGPRLEQNGDC